MILISIFLIILSCLIIWRASDGFEVASEYLGRNLSEGVRGATINAIGSSLPELFTTLFFLFILKDRDGFAGGIGTTAGSAIFNGMIIPAVVILIVVLKGVSKSINVSRKVLLRDGIALLLCELILIFSISGDSLNWTHGLFLMGLYIIYSSYMLLSMKGSSLEEFEDDEDNEDDESGNRRNLFVNLITIDLEPIFIKDSIKSNKAWLLLVASTIVISSSCFLLVKSCEWLGESLGIPVYFIAVVLASAATSVPDTILSMKDAKKGNFDDAVSNALGSNIFDVCFALGFPLFLFTIINGPIEMSPATIVNISELRILLFLLTFIAFFIYISKKSLGLLQAIMLLTIYIAFTVFIFGKSIDAEYALWISKGLQSIYQGVLTIIN